MSSTVVNCAREFARNAHYGQTDLMGRNYFSAHLASVAELLRPYGPTLEAAGWLHDVMEDQGATIESLAEAGITPEVIDIVFAVTRFPGVSYETYIRELHDNLHARMVKLADNYINLSGNAELAVVDPEKAARLLKRYTKARELLEFS